MLVIDENQNIHINRGDSGVIHFSTTESDGSVHTFEIGDIIRFSVKDKYSNPIPALRKDVIVSEETDTINIDLSKNDTTIGSLIDRPKKYVYDIAINEDETVVGYNEESGPKYFVLYPEASNDE